ncbi:MAG: amino acid ABC transporter substrate-binding protein [Spirochaetes bacterium]|nr:amino acid ABC transporter substrate-binding protein [Spirochaetota bacterium]
MKQRSILYRITIRCLFILFIGFLITGCSKGRGKEIIIGSHLPLSGPGGLVGLEQKWAYDQAVKDINDAGGIYVKEYDAKVPVRLIAIDDESDSGKAAAAVERLIKKDGVELILSGSNGAMGVLPGMITAEKYKVYYHGTLIWLETFLEHKFKNCSLYNFDMGQVIPMCFEVWNSLPKDQRPKRPAIFVEDSFDGKMMGDALTMFAKKFKYNVVLHQSMGLGAKDFTTQVIKAKSANADGIICLANTPETVTLVRQLKENDVSFKVFQGFKGTWPTEFYKSLGKDADYILCDGFWSEDYPFKGAKEIGQRFFDKYEKHSTSVGLYYALCQILFQAIEKAGSTDPVKVRQAITDNEFNTVNGKVKYDGRGVALYTSGNFQWMNGKQQNIYPFNLAKYKIKAAPPWKKR